MRLGDAVFDNEVPVPTTFDGAVRLDVVLSDGSTTAIEGDGLVVVLLDEGTYVEDFAQ